MQSGERFHSDHIMHHPCRVWVVGSIVKFSYHPRRILEILIPENNLWWETLSKKKKNDSAKSVSGLSGQISRSKSQAFFQDQDSLLVKRRNDNHSTGPVIRELVPSSHQRSELSNTILCIFSGWDQKTGEGIPIPDSLGEEATFINICIGNGSLNCHRVLISTTPSFGDKVICWYTGFTFKTFI